MIYIYMKILYANRFEPVSLLKNMSTNYCNSLLDRSGKHGSDFSRHGQNWVHAFLEPNTCRFMHAVGNSSKLYNCFDV